MPLLGRKEVELAMKIKTPASTSDLSSPMCNIPEDTTISLGVLCNRKKCLQAHKGLGDGLEWKPYCARQPLTASVEMVSNYRPSRGGSCICCCILPSPCEAINHRAGETLVPGLQHYVTSSGEVICLFLNSLCVPSGPQVRQIPMGKRYQPVLAKASPSFGQDRRICKGKEGLHFIPSFPS